MSDEPFKIYIDRLREGQTAHIKESLDPSFLGIQETELAFNKPVTVEGDAYIAGDTLILNLATLAVGTMKCAICNENTDVNIKISNFYHAEQLEDIKRGIFNFKELLREAILLETPAFAECNQGNCRKRKDIEKYLKKSQESDEGYHPFANL